MEEIIIDTLYNNIVIAETLIKRRHSGIQLENQLKVVTKF